MAVVAVINRKGGSGKSTLATHLAAYFAVRGESVMLGDVDRQQSSRLWLSQRPAAAPAISSWAIDERNFARPPAGSRHVVLDTPGGFQGVSLMRVALFADAILVPATSSLFDRTAAADSIAELRTQPRVASGKCRLACVGMRIDSRTRNAEVLAEWCMKLQLEHLGTIRAAQAYTRFLEQGLSLFDLPASAVGPNLVDWAPVMAWLDTVASGASAESDAPRAVPPGAAPGVLRRPVDGLPVTAVMRQRLGKPG